MNINKPKTLATLLLGTLAATCLSNAQSILFQEEFDGNGNGYNPDSTTALAGEQDWVDFSNRLTDNFNSFEGYATVAGTGESVLTASVLEGQNDPQIRADFDTNFDKTRVGRVEMRIRFDSDQDMDYDADDVVTAADVLIVYGTSLSGTPGATGGAGTGFSMGVPNSVTAQSDGWHLAVWNDKGGLTEGPTPTVRTLRIDPVNNKPGVSFELDFVKFYETEFTTLDPVDAIGPEFTLRQEWQWTADSQLDGWVPNAQFDVTTAPNGVSGGILTGTSSGGDPFITSPSFEVLDVESGRFIVELGIIGDVGDTSNKQLFWLLDGAGANPNQKVALPSVPNDGNPHVIRVLFDNVINGRITGLRYDPSTITGITSQIDYIRVYSEGPEIPYFPPPVTELNPGPLGPEFLLQNEWTFNTDDNLEGWTNIGLTIAEPNDTFTGVFDGAIFAESIINDSNLSSPTFAINAPSSQQYVVEIDYATDFGPNEAGQFFWTDNSGGPAPARSANMPFVPIDGGTVRITMTNNVDGALSRLRIDSTNTTGAYYGIDAVRIYTNGPPVSTQAPKITSFTYNSSSGAAEAQLVGNASTVYNFVSASDLDFTNSTAITLTGATVGVISGGGVETDGSGNATVQFNLGTSPKNFIRAED